MAKERDLITEPQELMRWMSEHDVLMDISAEDIQLILNYLDGHDYAMGTDKEGNLVRVDVAVEEGECIEYSLDEFIDLVCEWNYELILDADERRNNPKDMKESFIETKQELHDKAAEIVADTKARGKAALNRVSEFFGIKPRLEKMRDKMAQNIADTTRTINKIDALGTGIRESGQNLANTFRTFADKPEVDYSQKDKKFSKTEAIKKPWEAYRKSCEKFKLRLDAMIDKCENLSLDVELHKQEKSRSTEVVQTFMPMVAEKEYQYGAEAFEAFRRTDKAKEMAKAISTPDRDSVKVGKGR